jgi:hypothetical protein
MTTAAIAETIAKQAKVAALPDQLPHRVAQLLKRQPELSWDLAVAWIITGGEAP